MRRDRGRRKTELTIPRAGCRKSNKNGALAYDRADVIAILIPKAMMQSQRQKSLAHGARESAAATHSSVHETRSSMGGRTDGCECTRFCLHRSFLRRSTQRARMPRKRKQKRQRRIRVLARDREGRRKEEERGRKKGRDGSRRVHNSCAEGASYSCLARRGLYACSLKHERVSLCNKRARAARTICVTYAHNAVIMNDERNEGGRKREERKRNKPSVAMRKDARCVCVQCTRGHSRRSLRSRATNIVKALCAFAGITFRETSRRRKRNT